MSYSRVDGKDTIIFVEPEEHKEESSTDSKDTESPKADSEEGQAAAFDPETGEINWDCPCKYSRYDAIHVTVADTLRYKIWSGFDNPLSSIMK